MTGTSRMNREVHVRICGRLEVKFLRSTRRIGFLSSFYSDPELQHFAAIDRKGDIVYGAQWPKLFIEMLDLNRMHVS